MRTISHQQNTFARVIGILALITASFWTIGCSQSSSPSNTGTSPTKASVRTFTQVSGSTVTSSIISGKTPRVSGFHPTADSVVITHARIVISTLKLHQVGTLDSDTIIVGGGHGKGEGDKDKDEDQHDHINTQGRHSFAMPEAVVKGELRPLRNPADDLD